MSAKSVRVNLRPVSACNTMSVRPVDCRTIDITYDAAGTKLKSVSGNGSQPVREQVYVAGLEYVNGQLESVMHAEGCTYYENGNARREYNLTDHLSYHTNDTLNRPLSEFRAIYPSGKYYAWGMY